MWAVGCILGEMLNGRPIFPGTSTMNQLEKIMELTGTPDEQTTAKISKFAPNMVDAARSKGAHARTRTRTCMQNRPLHLSLSSVPLPTARVP